jgi:hypothetical protein
LFSAPAPDLAVPRYVGAALGVLMNVRAYALAAGLGLQGCATSAPPALISSRPAAPAPVASAPPQSSPSSVAALPAAPAASAAALPSRELGLKPVVLGNVSIELVGRGALLGGESMFEVADRRVVHRPELAKGLPSNVYIPTFDGFFGRWPTSASAVYHVPAGHSQTVAVFVHWDGRRWREVRGKLQGRGYSTEYRALGADRAGKALGVWMAWDYAASGPQILPYGFTTFANGRGATPSGFAPSRGKPDACPTVLAVPSAFAVTSSGATMVLGEHCAEGGLALERFNSKRGAGVVERIPSDVVGVDTAPNIVSSAALGETVYVALLEGGDRKTSRLLRRDESGWKQLALPAPGQIGRLVASANTLWLTLGGVLYGLEHERWSRAALAESETVHRVDIDDEGRLWLATASGVHSQFAVDEPLRLPSTEGLKVDDTECWLTSAVVGGLEDESKGYPRIAARLRGLGELARVLAFDDGYQLSFTGRRADVAEVAGRLAEFSVELSCGSVDTGAALPVELEASRGRFVSIDAPMREVVALNEEMERRLRGH